LLSDNIFPKRMMLVSPFVAVGLGLAQSRRSLGETGAD
jgi:hypothetical protein